MKKSIGERLWMNEVNLHRYHDEITQRHNGNLLTHSVDGHNYNGKVERRI